jgi:6,7-dimethyl-8-ribityllumazine synthase
MSEIRTIEGKLTAEGLKFALIATRFNDFIVDKLVGGAIDYLIRHGAKPEDITLVRNPPFRLRRRGGLEGPGPDRP